MPHSLGSQIQLKDLTLCAYPASRGHGSLASMGKSSAATTTTNPGHLPARLASDVNAPARAERRNALLRFLADPPRDIAEAARALRIAEEQYGDESDRELTDLEAGQHPLQRPKTDSSMG